MLWIYDWTHDRKVGEGAVGGGPAVRFLLRQPFRLLKRAFNVKQIDSAFYDLAFGDAKAVFAQKGKVLFGRPFVGKLDSYKGQYFLP